MGIDEYDAELHEKTLIDIGYERGHSEGIDIGREQGISASITNTISILKRNGFADSQIITELTTDFDITADEAENYLSKI